MRSLVATAMPIVSVCHTCGVVKKSDKRSCCARGGSWYGKCGGAGNKNREHTWYEGLQACKALQSQAVMVHQQNVVEQKNTNLSDDASMGINSQAATHMLPSTSVQIQLPRTMSVTASGTTPVSANTSIRMPMSVHLAHTLARTSIAYDTSAITSKAIIVAGITIIHTSVKMSTPRPTVQPTKSSISIQSLENDTNTKIGVREVSAGVVPPHTSASTLIQTRECGSVLNIATVVVMISVSLDYIS